MISRNGMKENRKCAYLMQLLLLSFKLLRFHLQSLGLIKRLLCLCSQLIDAVLGSERLLYKNSLEYGKWPWIYRTHWLLLH